MFVMIVDSFWQCLYIVPWRDVKTSSIVIFDAKDTSGFFNVYREAFKVLDKRMKNETTEEYHIKKTQGNDLRKRDLPFNWCKASHLL